MYYLLFIGTNEQTYINNFQKLLTFIDFITQRSTAFIELKL